MTKDTFHTYTYDAEGNVLAVDGGNTAQYTYDAFNQRARIIQGSADTVILHNPFGQRVSEGNVTLGRNLEGVSYWGSRPLSYATITPAQTHFEHQDWLGTERQRTSYSGAVEGTFTSLPFADGFAVASGTDTEAYHFAGLEHDSEDNTEHAQSRNYSSAQGRWLAPDPYDGSYDASNPQSFNRYAYVLNNPLSLTDPTGQLPGICAAIGVLVTGGPVTGEAGAAICGVAIAADVAESIFKLLGLFDGPSFHGSLKPRPNAQPWDEYNIQYGPNIAGALGLPDESCEFGACGGGSSYATGNVGVSVNYTLPFSLSGTLFAGFLCDTHLHCGFYWGGGGGGAVGAGASGGVQAGYSNGNTICAFGGPFNNYSGTFGAEAAGTADYFDGAGDAPGGIVRGGGVTLGVGGGGSASIYHTVTSIHPAGGHSCNAAGVIQ